MAHESWRAYARASGPVLKRGPPAAHFDPQSADARLIPTTGESASISQQVGSQYRGLGTEGDEPAKREVGDDGAAAAAAAAVDKVWTVRGAGLGSLSVLDDALLARIFGILDAADLSRVGCVSRVLHYMASQDLFWKPHVIRRDVGNIDFHGNWKRTFVFKGKEDSEIPPAVHIALPGFSSSYWYRFWYRAHVSLDQWSKLPDDIPAHRMVPRESADSLTYERFMRDYALPCKPVIITDLVTKWPAWTDGRWTSLAALEKRFGDILFKTDEVDINADHKLFLTMSNYLKYAASQQDEDPIYLFDDKFGERDGARDLLGDYEVPHYFKPDVFEHLKEDRPPYRWFIIGPDRSGSGFHTDPYRTSAWNALLMGRKRWAFYPYDKLPPGVDVEFDTTAVPGDSSSSSSSSSSESTSSGSSSSSESTSLSASSEDLEDQEKRKSRRRRRQRRQSRVAKRRLRQERKVRAEAWKWQGEPEDVRSFDADAPEPMKWMVEHYTRLPEHLKPIECFLEAGELIFVPGGWWHAVLNIGDTVAVTQNFANDHNINFVAAEIDFDDREFYDTFRDCVSQAEPTRTWEDRREALKRHEPYKE